MISIIIPAHNEAAVIRGNLAHLLAGALPGELQVIVACNGCTDETAALARAFGPPVQVLEIPTASKIAALNAADAVATAFPRVYLDADVRLDIAGVRALASALAANCAVPLVAPRLRMDLRQASWPVRAFYRVWTSLPYNQTMVGTGAYALSRAGRSRFGAFPDVIADDGFVRFQFRPEERGTVSDAGVWVRPPRTLAGLLRIKTRSRLGQRQLRARYPGLFFADQKPAKALLRELVARPSLWPCVPAYVGINFATRWRARGVRHSQAAYAWERDDSRIRGTLT
jgi:glycosyltransferase involved in cell wall biosynthesis